MEYSDISDEWEIEKPIEDIKQEEVVPVEPIKPEAPQYSDVSGDFEIETPQPETTAPVKSTLTNNQRVDSILSKVATGGLSENQTAAFNELKKRGVLKSDAGDDFSISSLGSALGSRIARAALGGEAEVKPEAEKKEELPLTEALSQGIKNLPSSAKNQVTALWDAATSPAKTWEGFKVLAKDIFKNSMETALKDMGFDPTENEAIFKEIEKTPALDTVVDDLEKTYTTWAGFKEAIATDPAQIITDLASVVAPVAKGVQTTSIAAKLPKVAKVAEVAAKTAALTEPLTLATMPVKKAGVAISKLTGKAFESLTPTGLYESATKMSTKIPTKERKRLANVALESGIMPTIKGLENVEKKITGIDKKIADMIEKSVETGKTMPLGKLFKEFKALKAERLLSGKAKSGVAAIENIRKGLLEANAKIKRGRLTPKEVQKLKQTIYKDLSGAYENMKNSTASVKAQKAVARSAKEYLEELLPEIKNLNKMDSDLIKLRGAIEGPASRIRNHQLMGLGSGMKLTAGAASGGMIGGPEMAALMSGLAVTQSVFDHPKVKAKLAIVLDKLQKQGVKIPENRAIYILLAEQAVKKAKETQEEKK